MKKTYLSMAIAALILSLASTAQAQSPGTVGAWGADYYGETTVPIAAQSGVTAIAAGHDHTVILKNDGSVVGEEARNIATAPTPPLLRNLLQRSPRK